MHEVWVLKFFPVTRLKSLQYGFDGEKYPCNGVRSVQNGLEPRPALNAEILLFPVKVIERLRHEHDALRITAVFKPEEMADLVRPLLHEPVHHIIIGMFSPVIPVGQPGSGHNACVDPPAGKAEDKIQARDEQVVRHYEQYGEVGADLAGIDILEGIENGLCIVLVAAVIKSPEKKGARLDIDGEGEYLGEHPGNGKLQALRRLRIPKHFDMHFP